MRRAEPIDLREKRYNFLPARFIWRGQPHRVHRVEQVWGEPGKGRRPPRNYFRVRCNDDRVYHLVQDVRINAWYLER